MSSFFGLDIARKALSTAQKGIDVTGHNIANAQTPGYSRQRLSLEALAPAALGSRFNAATQGISGGGVKIITVEQVRNPFLDRQFRHENALAQHFQMRSEDLRYLESLFHELSDTGIAAGFNQFLASLQEVSKSPTSKEYRTNLLQNAIKLTETFHHYARQLADKQVEQNRTVTVMTGQINDLATSIADLNVQIARYELSGQMANDLRDRRGLLLDELSGLTLFTATENSQGYLQVAIGSEYLVDHATARLLGTADGSKTAIGDPDLALKEVVWQDSQQPAELGNGRLQAILELRDGSSADDLGLPYLQENLDRLARALAESFNTVHAAGWSLPAGDRSSETGLDFFAVPLDGTGQPIPVTAATLRVSQAVIDDISRIALSGQPVDTVAVAGDNQNALALTELFSRQDLPDVGNLGHFLERFIAELAVETSQADKRLQGQNLLVESIDWQRQSISGVSLDEEMTRLISLQHSYAAASRMITAIDQNLDTLINRTGLVGR